MKQDIKNRWLARLESGEIKQTKRFLGRSNGSRCCLGVLCDIAVEDGIISPPTVEEDSTPTGRTYEYLNYAGSSGELPEEVVVWAGLNRANPEYNIRSGSVTTNLASLNDSSKYNFKKIADVIRKHF